MQSARLFSIFSWVVTGLIVLSLLGFTFWKIQPLESPTTAEFSPTIAPTAEDGKMPSLTSLSASTIKGIPRLVSLNTSIPEQARYYSEEYKVKRGDSVFGIAKQFNIKPETLLWANYDLLQDS
ncbi:LysM peptidoglycan-binding domain-containing protein, partial [bacterium]|nr:LysM peptidoglycan-binding domain-containing protein [bacterium]